MGHQNRNNIFSESGSELQRRVKPACDKLRVLWNQNMATNGVNIYRIAIKVVPLEY